MFRDKFFNDFSRARLRAGSRRSGPHGCKAIGEAYSAPELAVADGALGFWQAIEEVWSCRGPPPIMFNPRAWGGSRQHQRPHVRASV
jgi:hypothetical protein